MCSPGRFSLSVSLALPPREQCAVDARDAAVVVDQLLKLIIRQEFRANALRRRVNGRFSLFDRVSDCAVHAHRDGGDPGG